MTEKNDEQDSLAAGCATVLIIAGGIIWFLSSFLSSSEPDIGEIRARERDWPQSVLAAAEVFHPLGLAEPAEMFDTDLTARLNGCRELIRLLANEDFVMGVQFPRPDWDGTLGALANLAGHEQMASSQERIASFRSGKPLEEQWLIFGLTDSFSGTKQTFKIGKCSSMSRAVWVDICADDGHSFCNRRVIAVE